MSSLPARSRPIYTWLQWPGTARLGWQKPPQNIFVVTKNDDDIVRNAAKSFVSHIFERYRANVYLESKAYQELRLSFTRPVNAQILKYCVDVVVTMGGDGTILHAISLFKRHFPVIPPVLSFSMGSLGFLLPFDIKDSQTAFERVYNGESLVVRRSQLRVTLPERVADQHSSQLVHALNDLTIHRGSSPHLTQLDIAVNGKHVTTAISDGLIVATPTGSTAYSLSAGGSIVHPEVNCMLLTPICPRSLSFRPLILPSDASLSISVAEQARGASQVSVNGQNFGVLSYGDQLTVEIHPDDGVWCVSPRSDLDNWLQNLNSLLGFNSAFGKKRK